MSGVIDLTEKVQKQRRNIEDKTMSVKEFAKVMGCSENVAREMCRSQNPPPYIKIGNRYRIIIAKLDGWLDTVIGSQF